MDRQLGITPSSRKQTLQRLPHCQNLHTSPILQTLEHKPSTRTQHSLLSSTAESHLESWMKNFGSCCGGPDRTRTGDLLHVKQMSYLARLPAPVFSLIEEDLSIFSPKRFGVWIGKFVCSLLEQLASRKRNRRVYNLWVFSPLDTAVSHQNCHTTALTQVIELPPALNRTRMFHVKHFVNP